MSTFDDASLVLIPSGYKASKVYSVKPTDGTGDLTFTRSLDTATRVGADGLIEKVRTNLVTYSNTFSNAAWSKNNLTLTSGQADPNGGTTAFLVQSTATAAPTFGQANAAAARTTSIFAKVGTRSNFSILNGGYNNGAQFNLATQTATAFGVGSLAKIESVGSGWFRCSVFLSSTTETQFILTDIAGNGGVIGDNLTFAFAQSETGDIATPYIPTTTAAVSVGMLANVPRLDYTGGGCPKLLLEPQRVNLRTNSENFNTSGGWSAAVSGAATAVLTPNYGISPDGFQNADRLQLALNGGSFADWISYNGVTIGTTYTYSVYAKSLSGTKTLEFLGGTPTGNILKTITTEYTRLTHTFTAASGDLYPRFLLQAGTSTSVDILIYGSQLEVGSYATSYIPTLGAAVTRSADGASKTGISALIGQTEGTIFFDLPPTTLSNTLQTFALLELDGNINAGYAHLYKSSGLNEVIFQVNNAGALQCSLLFAINNNTSYKIAAVYKNNRFELYVNGVLRASDNSGTLATITMNKIQVAFDSFNPNSQIATNQVLLFKTALTQAQCEQLTA